MGLLPEWFLSVGVGHTKQKAGDEQTRVNAHRTRRKNQSTSR